MKVYGNPFSTCTRKVLATLAEKEKAFEFIVIDLGQREQKRPEHLARQPFGVVPVLEDDDGFQMYESRAIIRYLDGRLEGPSLTPADPRARARMDQYMSVEQSYFTPSAMQIIYNRVFNPMRGLPTDLEVVKKGQEGAERALDVLEKALAQQPYLAGDQFSLAEISMMPYLEYLSGTPEAEIITRREHVADWWKRISERPSWRKTTGRA